jgi:hypothetical protein
MTLTTLITLNAVLAALVVSGIVWLLGSAIGADRGRRLPRDLQDRRAETDEQRKRIAA